MGNRSCRGSDSLLRHGTDTERGKVLGDVIWDPRGDEGGERTLKWRGKKERGCIVDGGQVEERKREWRWEEDMTDSRGDGAHTVAHKDQGNLDPGHVRTFGPAGRLPFTRHTFDLDWFRFVCICTAL